MKENFKDFWEDHPFGDDKYRVNNMCIAETTWNYQEKRMKVLIEQQEKLVAIIKNFEALLK